MATDPTPLIWGFSAPLATFSMSAAARVISRLFFVTSASSKIIFYRLSNSRAKAAEKTLRWREGENSRGEWRGKIDFG
jgi:hypothetical protein